jgi:hypothetical protein
MGFSHEKTTHHFHLFKNGGSIEIASNDPADTESQKAIREHLAMIATKFSKGDFCYSNVYPRYGAAGSRSNETAEQKNLLRR